MTDDTRLAFLHDIGVAEVRHNSDEDLLPHLQATAKLLQAWGARRSLCDAGLFHSVYGTEYFNVATLADDTRDAVRAVVGAEAEALVWLWCFGRRLSLPQQPEGALRIEDRRTGAPIHIARQQYEDLVNLWFADTLEQLPRVPDREVPTARLLRSYGPWALAGANAALEEVLARYPSSS